MNNLHTTGSPSSWESVWRDYSGPQHDRTCLFVKGRAKTLLQFRQRCYAEDLERFIEGRSYHAFLELGSGRGTTSMYLRSFGHDDITLVDLSETALKMAEWNFQHHGLLPPALVKADVEATGLPPARYDVIYNIGLLEHFDDVRPVLDECYRLLAPGGAIFMVIVPEVPRPQGLRQRALLAPWSVPLDLARALFRRSHAEAKPHDAYRSSSDRSFYARAAAEARFIDVCCCPYNPYWDVTTPDGAWERTVLLPLYALHYRLFGRFRRPKVLATNPAFGKCFLLTATKPPDAVIQSAGDNSRLASQSANTST